MKQPTSVVGTFETCGEAVCEDQSILLGEIGKALLALSSSQFGPAVVVVQNDCDHSHVSPESPRVQS